MTARRACLGIFAFLCAALLSEDALAEVKEWKVLASANYETGKYGTDSRSETWYMPVTIKRYFLVGDVSMTIPYVQTSGSGVTTIDGNVFQISAGGPQVTNSGMGDVVLRGSYYFLSEGKSVPFDLNLTGKLKVPTADDSKGLGTGEFDIGAGLEFAKSLPDGFTGYLDIYYTSIGDPPGFELEDRVSFDIGLSRALAPKWTVSAFYEESTPLLMSNPHLRDFLVSFDFKANSRTRVFFGATLGLTGASPDYGLSAGASFLL
ncbi:hypothetical protein BAC1_00415 [uncultured bacterium]|nr:hypothetical protein BAC1_00415 [uncultured bacterium]